MECDASLAIVLVLGIGLIVTATLSGFGGGTGAIGAGLRIGAIAVAFALNVVVFSVVFRLAIVEVAWKNLWLGAFLTALGWEVLLTVGGYLIAHDVKNMSAVYGTFALVLGLMSWLYLQAEITLYAVEIDVVRVQRRWPRSVTSPKRTASPAPSAGRYRCKYWESMTRAAAAMSANASQPRMFAALPLRYSPMTVRSRAISITTTRNGAAAMPLMTATSTSRWIGLLVSSDRMVPPTVPTATRP